MQVPSLYAALLTFLFVALSIRTLKLRGRLKIGLGDAGNDQMLRAMRVHANFAEYVPLGLVLLFLTHSQGAHVLFLHGLGSCLLIGRLSHALGVSQVKEDYRFRVVGMALTFVALLSSSAFLLFSFGRAAFGGA